MGRSCPAGLVSPSPAEQVRGVQLSLQPMAVSWHSVKRFERVRRARKESREGERAEPTVTGVEPSRAADSLSWYVVSSEL